MSEKEEEFLDNMLIDSSFERILIRHKYRKFQITVFDLSNYG